MFDRDIILIGFEYFLSYLWLSLFAVKNSNIKSAFTRVIYNWSTYAEVVNIIKYLEIYSQFF